jgi:serine/threonine protein kinase
LCSETLPPDAPNAERTQALLRWLENRIALDERGRPLGSGYQAAADFYATPYGDVALKRVQGTRLSKALGRFTIRREYRAYQRLGSVAGIPRAYGLIAGEMLVLEHIAGGSLRDGEAELADRERFYAGFLDTLRAMHAAGVAHGDLKRKDNILIGPGERAYLIDFGIACLAASRSRWWNRRLFAWMRQADYNAWVKLKYRRHLENMSAADSRMYRPLVLERLARWIRIPYQKLTLRRLRKRSRTRKST